MDTIPLIEDDKDDKAYSDGWDRETFSETSRSSSEPFAGVVSPRPTARRTSRRTLFLAFFGMLFSILCISGLIGRAKRQVYGISSSGPLFASYFNRLDAAGRNLPALSGPRAAFADLCHICNCDASPAFYQPSGKYWNIPARPHPEHIYRADGSVDVDSFLRLTILDEYCSRQRITSRQALRLLQGYMHRQDDMMAWSVKSLKSHAPTMYLLTTTWPNSKSGAGRPQHILRHSRAIRQYMAQQKRKGGKGLQVIWILTEDQAFIDPKIAEILKRSGVPFIYFAYGMTNTWAMPQKIAGMGMVYSLSRAPGRGLYGHGPVYGMDDDNKVTPGAFELISKVKLIGVFPVGNLPRSGDWEFPTIDKDGRVNGSNSLWRRPYGFDYGAFSYHSSVLGTVVGGPYFYKYSGWGGESEFIGEMVEHIQELEPLCGDSQKAQEKCHTVWHNKLLTSVERMEPGAEKALVEQSGAAGLVTVCSGDGTIIPKINPNVVRGIGSRARASAKHQEAFTHFAGEFSRDRIQLLLARNEDVCGTVYGSEYWESLLELSHAD